MQVCAKLLRPRKRSVLFKSVKNIFSESNAEVNIEIEETADLFTELMQIELDVNFVSKDDKSILYYLGG